MAAVGFLGLAQVVQFDARLESERGWMIWAKLWSWGESALRGHVTSDWQELVSIAGFLGWVPGVLGLATVVWFTVQRSVRVALAVFVTVLLLTGPVMAAIDSILWAFQSEFWRCWLLSTVFAALAGWRWVWETADDGKRTADV